MYLYRTLKDWRVIGNVSRHYQRINFHTSHEPPHFAYRGDGLQKVRCEEIQKLVHMSDRQSLKPTEPLRQSKDPLYKYECSIEGTALEAYNELKELHDRILSTNWHDTIQLTMNVDIWNGVLHRIMKKAQDLPDVQVQKMLKNTLDIFDVLFKVEDVQDHIYELCEDLSINAGDGGNATLSNKVTPNIDEHVKHVLDAYNNLKLEYPKFANKIQDAIGYSLANLRQRYTFGWPEEHKYFY